MHVKLAECIAIHKVYISLASHYLAMKLTIISSIFVMEDGILPVIELSLRCRDIDRNKRVTRPICEKERTLHKKKAMVQINMSDLWVYIFSSKMYDSLM